MKPKVNRKIEKFDICKECGGKGMVKKKVKGVKGGK